MPESWFPEPTAGLPPFVIGASWREALEAQLGLRRRPHAFDPELGDGEPPHARDRGRCCELLRAAWVHHTAVQPVHEAGCSAAHYPGTACPVRPSADPAATEAAAPVPGSPSWEQRARYIRALLDLVDFARRETDRAQLGQEMSSVTVIGDFLARLDEARAGYAGMLDA